MNNEQTQVAIDDEVVAVRVLSVVFITFMLLIIGSYSDAPQVSTTPTQNTLSQVSMHPTTVTVAINLVKK